MAYYAFINDANVVVKVISGVDENIIQVDADGNSIGGSTQAWEDFYASQPQNAGLVCKRTSFNNKIRKQFAGIGSIYDAENDIFLSPQPYPSWIKDENHDWQPPVAKPNDGFYIWDESNLEWIRVES
jgi:hypothetical protein